MKGLLSVWRSRSFGEKVAFMLIAAVALMLLVTYSLSIFRSYCNADAGYYIGVTNLIHQGLCPYRDFQLNYPPVFFYLMQLPRALMGDNLSYELFLAFIYLIAAADAFLVGKIIRSTGGSRLSAVVSALCFLALYYYLDGAYCILEGLAVLFGLLGLYFVIAGKEGLPIFLAGAFASLSFMTKQYALVFAAAIFFYLLFAEKEWKIKLKTCCSFAGGFVLLLVIIIGMFYMSGLSPQKLFSSLFGIGYGAQTMDSLINGTVRLVKIYPFLLLIPVLFVKTQRKGLAVAIACGAGLLLSMLQFFFNGFSHYYIISSPFAVIMAALLWKKASKGGVLFYVLICTFSIIAATVLQHDYKSMKAMAKHNLRSEQNELCACVEQLAGKYEFKSCLCTMRTMPLYALYPIMPSAMKEYAFSFGQDTDSSMIERLKDADCVVLCEDDLRNAMFPVFSKTIESSFDKVGQSGNTHIYIRIPKGQEP